MRLGLRATKMRRNAALALAGLTALVGGLAAAPRALALIDVGPLDPATGFPTWYEDENSVSLQQCTNAAACAPVANGESLYFNAKALFGAGGGNSFDVALIGGFPRAATATPANALTFARIRVRMSGLAPATSYKVTHPYGTMDVSSDAKGVVNAQQIFGCVAAPCDFHAVVAASPIKPFLTWDPATAPAAPAGFIGNPFVDHTVTGSPFGTNFVQVDGPNAGGAGVNTFKTNVFRLQGQLAVGPFRAPAAPTGLAGHAGPGAGTVSIAWQRPALDGGTPITGYTVYAGTDPAALTPVTTVAASTLSFVDTGRPDNITMHYQVTALNSAGESVRSADLALSTLTSPTAPQAVSATAGPGVGEASLAWSAPQSQGSTALSGYRVYRGDDAGHLAPIADLDAGALSYDDTGLANGTTYFYAVTASNSIGESAASVVVSATTFDRPSAVQSLSVTAGPLPLQATVTWTAPLHEGGTPITSYAIYRSPAASGASTLVATVPATQTTYADMPLAPLTAYHYEVAAVNMVGESIHVSSCGHASPWIDALSAVSPC